MLYKRLKQITLSLTLSIFLFSTIGSSVGGVRLVNNTSSNSDYKLEGQEAETLTHTIKCRSDIVEYFTNVSAPKLTENDILNYLIENDIISRENKISFSEDGIEIETPTLDAYKKLNKTEILMMLYKARYGVINSRPFIYTCNSKRAVNGELKVLTGTQQYTPANYTGNETTFDFTEGDKEVYISPNVEELYLTQLLDKGIIKLNEIKDQTFVKDYETLSSGGAGKLPEWWNELQPYDYIQSKVNPSTQLGSGWEFKGIMRVFNAHTTDFYLEKVEKKFFIDENMTKLKLYDYICKMFNYTIEGDPTELAFKYGNADINGLSNSDKNNIFALLEQGVISKDNDIELTDLNSKFNSNAILTIVYRLVNKDARVNNAVELSEQDKEFIKDGYSKNSLNIVDNSLSAAPITVSIKESPSPVASYRFNFASKDISPKNFRVIPLKKKGFWSTVKDGLNTVVDGVKNVVSKVDDIIRDNLIGDLASDIEKNSGQTIGTVLSNKDNNQSSSTEEDTPNSNEVPTEEIVNTNNPNPSESETETEAETTNTNSTTKEVRLTGKTIVIDPGHGDGKNGNEDLLTEQEQVSPDRDKGEKQKDTKGAYEPVERDVNWAIAQQLKTKLEGKGATVVMTKDSVEKALSSQARANIGNDKNADMVVRLHCDDGGEDKDKYVMYVVPPSTSSYFTQEVRNKTIDYSEKIITSLASATGTENKGKFEEDLTGAYWSKVPSVLIEMGNLANEEEREALKSEDYQGKVATAIAEGILESIGKEEEVENAPVTLSSSTPVTTEEKEDTTSLKTYSIVRIFPLPDKVTYNNKKITELSSSDDDVKDVKDATGGKQVEFSIKARNDVEALALLDSKTNYKVIADSSTKLQTVTKLTSDKKTTVYVSKSELAKGMSEISVLGEKILKNMMTGDMAVLLEDNNTALVGNRIIKSSSPMVIINTADTYYNLELIASLMTNAYMSELDPGKLFINTDLIGETYLDVKGTGGIIERTKVINNTSISDISFTDVQKYYDITTLSKAVSTLTRDYVIDDKKATLIVDWSYSLPADAEGNIDNSILELYKDENFTVKSASEFLYTRPTQEVQQSWWDNNIELSNALANQIYGTNNVNYINSGYLKPDITILLYDDLDSTKAIQTIFAGINLSDSYQNKYMDGSLDGFNTKLFGGTGDVTGRRSFNCIKGKKSDATGYYVFDSTYITAPTGSIYKSLASDSRLKYNSTDKVLELNKNSTADIVPDNIVVTYKGEEFLLKRASYLSKYYTLISTTPIIGELTTTGNNPSPTLTIKNAQSNDVIYETIGAIISRLGFADGEYKPLSKYRKEDFSYTPSTTLYQNNTYYLGNNKVYRTQVDDLVEMDSSNVQGIIVETYPAIYVSSSDFTVKNGELVKQRSNPYLEQGNVFFSGINSTLMYRLIDNQLSSVKLSGIPDGSTVVIQDFAFVKKGDKLYSGVIHDGVFAQDLLTSRGTDTATQLIASKFTGLSMFYSGRDVPFTSYITSGDIGIFIGEDSDINNTVYVNASGELEFRQSPSSSVELYSNQSVNSICFSMRLDSDLEFYCLDTKSKTYTLKQSTEKYSEGYVTNNPFFEEDLGVTIYDDAYFDMYNRIYNGVGDYDKYFEAANKQYESYLKGDLINIVQWIFALLLMYLIIMSWIIFAVLKLNVGLNFLLHLRNPSGMQGAEGFDLIKVLSLGLFTLDSEVNSGVFFVANVLFFLLFYLNYHLAEILQRIFY